MRLPNVVSRGFIYVRDSEALVTDIENKAKELYENYYSETKNSTLISFITYYYQL